MSVEIIGTESKEPAKRHSGISVLLNKYFHHIDRGGSLKSEISSGILVFIIAVCGIFLNMQLIAKLGISGDVASSNTTQLAANGEVYASTYFVSMLIAFLGSLMIGLIARLPLVQVSSLGLSTVLISLMGIGSGLTYYNLLAISFCSSIAYAVLVSVPLVNKFVFQAIPASVRKALPAAAGLLLVYVAMQLSGIITVGSSSISVYGTGAEMENVSDTASLSSLVSFGKFSYATDKFHPLLLVSALTVLLTFVFYLIYKKSSKHPYLYSLLSGTGIFLVFSICAVGINWHNFQFSLDSLWGRLWMIGSEDAMQYHLTNVFANLSFGKIFSEGFNFSTYTSNGGNVVILFVAGMLTFLFMSMYDAEATLRAASASSNAFNADNQKDMKLALMCNAGINVLAPLFGAAPIAIGKESYAGTQDGSKSGLASIIASIGFAISMFAWIIPALFSTAPSYDIVFNMYGHYGTVMQLLTECSFGIVDAILVILGLSMIKHSMDIDWKNYSEYAPFAVTIAGTFFLSNIAYGVAIGTIAFMIIRLTLIGKPASGKNPEGIAEFGIPTAVMGVLSVIMMVLVAVL
ncbi:MAG TPA: hypothetical protein VN258_18805 [Mobilitalea sp.]|nr:hypothetical protein [Mobilitalea sp.]